MKKLLSLFFLAATLCRADTEVTALPGQSVYLTWDYEGSKPPANCEFVIADVTLGQATPETILARTAGYPAYTLPAMSAGKHLLAVYVKENVDPFRRSGYSNILTVAVLSSSPPLSPSLAAPVNLKGKPLF